MTTYRIIEALEDVAGVPRYWVFAVTKLGVRCIASNAKKRPALQRVVDRCQDEDVVESIRGTELIHEEFGSEFRQRMAPYLTPTK